MDLGSKKGRKYPMQAVVRGIRCVVAASNYSVGDIITRSTSPIIHDLSHSCKPNVVLRDSGLTAMQSIEKGAELTMDLTCSTVELQSEKTCSECGAVLRGFTTQCMASVGNI